MARRTLLFFMRPAEFSSPIWEAAEKDKLTVIFQYHGRQSFKEIARGPGSLTMADGSPVHNVYLTFNRPEPWMVEGSHTDPARWGWLDVDVPWEVGSILFLAQMGAVSDWWDEEKRETRETPESLLLFRKVAALFRKRLRRPVWVYDVALGGKPSITRDIWYTEGAAEWVRGGGQLRQAGAAGHIPTIARFLIDEPAGPIRPPTAQELIQDFLTCPEQSLRWSSGNALCLIADDSVFEQVVEIVRDRRHGAARQGVVKALAKMRDPRTVHVLIDLLADEEVAEDAIIALGRLGAVRARPHVERFLHHSDPLIRIRAKQALADMDKRK